MRQPQYFLQDHCCCYHCDLIVVCLDNAKIAVVQQNNSSSAELINAAVSLPKLRGQLENGSRKTYGLQDGLARPGPAKQFTACGVADTHGQASLFAARPYEDAASFHILARPYRSTFCGCLNRPTRARLLLCATLNTWLGMIVDSVDCDLKEDAYNSGEQLIVSFPIPSRNIPTFLEGFHIGLLSLQHLKPGSALLRTVCRAMCRATAPLQHDWLCCNYLQLCPALSNDDVNVSISGHSKCMVQPQA